jgi:hypothetical protein
VRPLGERRDGAGGVGERHPPIVAAGEELLLARCGRRQDGAGVDAQRSLACAIDAVSPRNAAATTKAPKEKSCVVAMLDVARILAGLSSVGRTTPCQP